MPLTLFIAVVLFIIYSAAGFIGVPYYFSKILPKKFFAATGLYLHSAAVHFNPYTFSLIAEGLSVEDTGEKPIVFVDKINTRLALLPLLRAEWVCSELMLRRVQFNIVRIEKNHYNISKLLPEFRDNGSDGIMNFSELPFYFSLNNIDIQKADILFDDQLTATAHRITDISLRIPTISNFSYEIKHYVSPYFSATINGTAMEMIGKKDGNPQVLTATLSNFSLEKYQPYLPVKLPVTLEGGRLDGTIDIDFINFISPQINSKLPSKKNILVYFLEPEHTTLQANTAVTQTAVPTSNTFSLLLKNLLISQGQIMLTAEKEREVWDNITLQAENLHADTDRTKPAADDNTLPGSIRMRAQYAAVQNSPQAGKEELNTNLYLQADISPYHGRGAPRFANMTVEIENLHDPKTIFRSLGLDIANDDSFSFAAKKIRLGPINTHSTPFSLGKLSIVGGKIHSKQEQPPLFLQLLLQTSPPFFDLPAISYRGSFTLDSAQDQEQPFSIADLSFNGYGVWGKTMETNFSAFLSPKEKEMLGSLNPPQIQGEGTLSFIPFSLQAKVNLQNIALGKELPPFLFAAPDQPFSGILSGKGSLFIPKGDFSGNFTITNGTIGNNPTATTWEQLHAEGVTVKNILNKEREITLQKMALKNLHTSVVFDDKEPPLANVTRSLNMFRQKNATINTFQISESEIKIEDRRITPFWRAAISNISATITPLQTSPVIESEVYFSGNLQQGVLEARGSMQLNKPLYDTRLSFTGRDIPNALFGKQLPKETLLEASAGTADFSLNSLWINDKMSSRGEVLFSGVKAASEKSNIATALAIAGGTQQKFALEIELSSSPGERTVPLYYTFYRRLHRHLLKAEVSPLLLAGKEFRPLAKGQNIQFLQGKKELTTSGEKNLQHYFKLVKEYPQITLTMILAESDNEAEEAQELLASRLKYLTTRRNRELSANNAKRISLLTMPAEKQKPDVVRVEVHPLVQGKTPDHKQTGEQLQSGL